MRIALLMLGGLLLLVSSFTTHAHQQKQTLSTALFNERSGRLEVSHRFYIHDAEHAVKKLVSNKADLMAKSETQLTFGEYVKSKFSLRVNGKPVNFTYVGHEVDGKFFWVYQEAALPKNAERLEVKHQVLWEIWPAQRNIVNIEKAGVTRSLEFVKGDDWKPLSLDKL